MWLFPGVTSGGSFVHATLEILFTNWLPFFGTNDTDLFMCDLNSVETHQGHSYIYFVVVVATNTGSSSC